MQSERAAESSSLRAGGCRGRGDLPSCRGKAARGPAEAQSRQYEVLTGAPGAIAPWLPSRRLNRAYCLVATLGRMISSVKVHLYESVGWPYPRITDTFLSS